MKRIISIVVALILLFSNLAIGAFASETKTAEQVALLNLACEVFPEHAAIIWGTSIDTYQTPRGCEDNHIVFSETRKISENESLTIIQYASSDVVVSKSSVSWCPISDSSNVSTSSTGVRGYASFELATNNGIGTFRLSNVQFQIMFNSSDYFTNYGTASYDYGIRFGTVTNSPTYIHYPISFNTHGSMTYSLDFEVYFSNNQVVGYAWY